MHRLYIYISMSQYIKLMKRDFIKTEFYFDFKKPIDRQ